MTTDIAITNQKSSIKIKPFIMLNANESISNDWKKDDLVLDKIDDIDPNLQNMEKQNDANMENQKSSIDEQKDNHDEINNNHKDNLSLDRQSFDQNKLLETNTSDSVKLHSDWVLETWQDSCIKTSSINFSFELSEDTLCQNFFYKNQEDKKTDKKSYKLWNTKNIYYCDKYWSHLYVWDVIFVVNILWEVNKIIVPSIFESNEFETMWQIFESTWVIMLTLSKYANEENKFYIYDTKSNIWLLLKHNDNFYADKFGNIKDFKFNLFGEANGDMEVVYSFFMERYIIQNISKDWSIYTWEVAKRIVCSDEEFVYHTNINSNSLFAKSSGILKTWSVDWYRYILSNLSINIEEEQYQISYKFDIAQDYDVENILINSKWDVFLFAKNHKKQNEWYVIIYAIRSNQYKNPDYIKTSYSCFENIKLSHEENDKTHIVYIAKSENKPWDFVVGVFDNTNFSYKFFSNFVSKEYIIPSKTYITYSNLNGIKYIISSIRNNDNPLIIYQYIIEFVKNIDECVWMQKEKTNKTNSIEDYRSIVENWWIKYNDLLIENKKLKNKIEKMEIFEEIIGQITIKDSWGIFGKKKIEIKNEILFMEMIEKIQKW